MTVLCFIRSGHRGLTLVELLVSFLVLAIGIVALLGLAGQSALNARYSVDRTTASLLAQRRMDELLSDPNLQPQEASGSFEAPYERFGWTATVEEWILPGEQAILSIERVNLYKVTVTVFWRDRGTERRVQLSTLTVPGILSANSPPAMVEQRAAGAQ